MDSSAEMHSPRALVVHESHFGNTLAVARVVADALLAHAMALEEGDVSEIDVGDAHSFDLVVVGAPTQAFSLSHPSTRAEAHRRGAVHGTIGLGMREWLTALPYAAALVGTGVPRPQFAVFDTRVGRLRHLHAAAPRAARLLRHKGYVVVGQPAGFCVADVAGPLLSGELSRAAAWAAEVATDLTPAPTT